MLFLNTCHRRPTDRTPIWLMRQAGRYMAAYRKLREKHGLLELVKTPELACEVTLQPIRAFGLDAAIIFADILPLLEAMGMPLEFVKGEGPQLGNPIRSRADVERLALTAPEETLAFTLNAIRLVRPELDSIGVPLIGFSGAPFTLASYAVEGHGSRDLLLTKQLMWSEPETWHLLMNKLSQMIARYLVAQAEAGAQALQIFDSWAGALGPQDFQYYAAPYIKQIIETVRGKVPSVPIIYFSTGTASYVDLIAQVGADVVSIDWRSNLSEAWQKIGTDKPIQGNLDPVMLMGPWPQIEATVKQMLKQASSVEPNRLGYIFNLGHGILQHTPEDNVKRLVELVKTSVCNDAQ